VNAVIFDVDGTLADVSGVRHYVLPLPFERNGRSHKGSKNFEKFHAGASLVHPVPLVVEAAQGLHEAGFSIIVMTSRKQRWEYRTIQWLNKWNVPWSILAMRDDADERKDNVVKRDLYEKILATFPEVRVRLAFDDNPTVVELWCSLDIPVVRVPGWIEDH
jgi:phosphoglycolate phosphatase-like HAD superfamily hydrolase